MLLVLIWLGLHVPITPSSDSELKLGAVAPKQSNGIASNVGSIEGTTVMVLETVVAQTPALGVNVKLNVPAAAVLTVAGDQVPDILFVEVVGKVGAVAP